MILHELYTNSVKYRAWCTDKGSIDLGWSLDGGEVVLAWTERGQACPDRAPPSGFGQRMIEMSVKSDLGGTIERRWTADGLAVAIRFPVHPS